MLSEEFQAKVRATTWKWDHEWLRYLSMENKSYQFYFYDLHQSKYRLEQTTEQILGLSAEEFYHAGLFKKMRPHIWLPGSALVSKVILEMGCGPGMFGRLAGRFAKAYFGIDASKFALSIAKLTSPEQCKYIHLSKTRRIASLQEIHRRLRLTPLLHSPQLRRLALDIEAASRSHQARGNDPGGLLFQSRGA